MITNNLRLIATVSLDFYTNNIKTINVKQYDSKSRYIQVSFTEHGKKVELNKDTLSVIARYKKSDGKFGLQDCEILDDGTVMIQTTEQMLAVSGRCRLDVVILESNGLHVENFCDVTSLDDIDCAILSTMPLDLNVIACPVNDGELQSEYDFTALNNALAETKAAEEDLVEKHAEWSQAEDARVEAEKKREKNVEELIKECQGKTDEAIQKANNATTNANDATASARTATENANTAALNASDAAAYANTEAGKCKEVYQDVSADAAVVIEKCETAQNRANLAAQNCEDIVANVQSDWNDTATDSGSYIKNKPAIKSGTGTDSIVIGTGNSQGKNSVSASVNNSDEITQIKNLAQLAGYTVDTDIATAYADSSLALGIGAKAYSTGSSAMGISNSAGCLGFYWHSIDWSGTNPVIQLSTEQKPYRYYKLLGQKIEQNKTAVWNTDAGNLLAGWAVGDALSMVNNDKFGEQIVITAIDSAKGKITVESLPFTSDEVKVEFSSLSDITSLILTFDDFSIYNPSKPNKGSVALAYGALALGLMTNASGSFSTAQGYGSKVVMDFGHAEGYQAVASYSAHAEGYITNALGKNAHSEGARTTALGNQSHAEGYRGTAMGSASHIEGGSDNNVPEYFDVYSDNDDIIADWQDNKFSLAKGAFSHVEGKHNLALMTCAHAEGLCNIATGNYSHAEGKETQATLHTAHSEGYKTVASASQSHAEGEQTIASGTAAHSEGYLSEASGRCSHAEGNLSKAIGNNSHAEGYDTTANSFCTHAEGRGTIASSPSQHVQGKYNIEDATDSRSSYAHIIGNGTEEVRSNAHTVDWDGNAWYQGDISFGGTTENPKVKLSYNESTGRLIISVK